MENSSTTFTGKISTTNPLIPLCFQILLDSIVVYENQAVTETVDFEFSVAEDEAAHKLEFVMSGKTSEHTQVDNQGNITSDVMLMLSDVKIDGIDVNQLITELAVYTHNFNGTQPEIKDQFFGHIGCNGSIALEFYSPIYLWLLEKM